MPHREPHPARRFHGVRLVLLLLVAGCAPIATIRGGAVAGPGSLGMELSSIFDDPAFAHAHWGVVVYTPRTGETIVRRNGWRLFLPASNMKLVTGAAALEALGPEFRYRTVVGAAGPVRDGVLGGDLVIRGGGDPSISGRFHGEAREVFRAWADSLRAHGVYRVSGSIVGVEDYLEPVRYGRGWSWDDLQYAYSAPISSLQYDDASFRVEVFPSRQVGSPALLSIEPPTGHVRVLNRIVTTAAGVARVSFGYTDEGSLLLTGEIPTDTLAVTLTVAVRDPAHYFVHVLRETLRESGIQVDGPPLVSDGMDLEPGTRQVTPLFTHSSATLREIMPAFMKPSQNQIAEILLRTLGKELRGVGTDAAGVAVVDSMMNAWGLPADQLVVADGSGLSRYNFASPDFLIALLDRMARSHYRELWYGALPVAGVDGTLRGRLLGTPAQGRVHAKTGTLFNTRALSGYATTAEGETVIFSMVVNAHALTAADADRLIDRALIRLASFSRSAALEAGSARRQVAQR
jgi:serine-type D-Ala-D-Ala carboxypeptidase/endopeptidase (penicillin-binding protein 4)